MWIDDGNMVLLQPLRYASLPHLLGRGLFLPGGAQICAVTACGSVCRACYEGYYQDLYLIPALPAAVRIISATFARAAGPLPGPYPRADWDPYPYSLSSSPAYGPGRGPGPGRGIQAPARTPAITVSAPSVPPNAEPSSPDMNQKGARWFYGQKSAAVIFTDKVNGS